MEARVEKLPRKKKLYRLLQRSKLSSDIHLTASLDQVNQSNTVKQIDPEKIFSVM